MKKLKFLAFALFAVLACVNFASCSDDDKDNPTADIIGTWECVDSENLDDSGENDSFDRGTLLRLLNGGKCFIGYHGSFEIYNPETGGWETVADPTEKQWVDEEGDRWDLKGNNLTVREPDLDRYVGTITVNGNEMTFTYKYQNWNYDSGTMTSESGTYVSKFIKK